jgi:hypothetical protein
MPFRPLPLLFLLLLTWSVPSNAQNSKLFDIEIAKIKVGNLIVEKVQKDSLSIYIFKSEVDAWLLVHIRVSHLITCVYKNDKLLKANIHSIINNKTYLSSIEWKKDHYDYDCSTYKYY